MRKVVIDRGNSYTKIGLFEGDTIAGVRSVHNNDPGQIVEIVRSYDPRGIIVSSVEKSFDFHALRCDAVNFLVLDSRTPLPFSNEYLTPNTLGHDRVAAMAGAQELFPGKTALVIDAGSAITFDILVKGKTYLGGAISPGLEMRFKALNAYTSKLPLVSKQEDHQFPGRKTINAIAAGVINGMIFEIEGYINECKMNHDIEIVIITGGDANFFAGKLKKPIFASCNLVLIGLNRILNHNV